jgi:hypothetical protein
MIKKFTEAWFANKHAIREKFSEKHPECYKDVVRIVVQMLFDALDDYERPDPTRIHEIDDGEYQGTLVYVVGGHGYQPSRYWYAMVSYGSCSGCDTFQSIRGYGEGKPNHQQVDEYMTLALHIVQGMREMGDDD